MATAAELFPNEPITQQFAARAIDAIQQANLGIPLTKENIGAIVQTFARGESFDDLDKFVGDVLFHFTFERNVDAARQAGIVNKIAEKQINDVTGQIANGGLSFSLSGSAAGSGTAPDDAVVSGQQISTDAEGNETITATGILAGGTLLRVKRPGREDLWAITYPTGGGERVFYQFDPAGGEDGIPTAVRETFGDDLPSIVVKDEAWFNANEGKTLFFAGESGEVAGLSGDWNQLYTDVQRKALQAAGVNDPGLQGKLLASPEVKRLIGRAAIAGQEISGPQIQAELRRTAVYQQIYPGIDFFIKRGDANPEAAWRQYQANVEPIARRLGFPQDSDGTYRNTIGAMLEKRISADKLRTFAPVAEKIKQNPNLKPTMDQWALIEIGRPLDFNEFLDVLEGTSDPQLNKIVEAATLADAAQKSGLNVSVADLRRIAAATDLTPEAALRSFTEADKQLLAIGQADLQKFGVSREDFIDRAAGVAPRSGLSAAAVDNLAAKLAFERGISDDPEARFFAQTNRSGQLQRSGLQVGRQVGG